MASFSLVPLTKRLLGWLSRVLQTLGCCCFPKPLASLPLSGEASWENPRLCLRPATTAALCQGRPSRHRVTTGPSLTHISDSPGRTRARWMLGIRWLEAGEGVDEMAFCGPHPRIPGLSPTKLASAQIRRTVSSGEARKGCTHSLFSASLLEGGQFCVCSGTSFDVLTGSAFCTCQGQAHPSAPDRWREGGLAAENQLESSSF